MAAIPKAATSRLHHRIDRAERSALACLGSVTGVVVFLRGLLSRQRVIGCPDLSLDDPPDSAGYSRHLGGDRKPDSARSDSPRLITRVIFGEVPVNLRRPRG